VTARRGEARRPPPRALSAPLFVIALRVHLYGLRHKRADRAIAIGPTPRPILVRAGSERRSQHRAGGAAGDDASPDGRAAPRRDTNAQPRNVARVRRHGRVRVPMMQRPPHPRLRTGHASSARRAAGARARTANDAQRRRLDASGATTTLAASSSRSSRSPNRRSKTDQGEAHGQLRPKLPELL
jgi:hypothetical protein